MSPRYSVSLQATPRAITDPFLSMDRDASADYVLALQLALHAVMSECHAARACCLVHILSRGCMTQLLWGPSAISLFLQMGAAREGLCENEEAVASADESAMPCAGAQNSNMSKALTS